MKLNALIAISLWAVTMVGAVGGTIVWAYATFEQKTDTEEFKKDTQSRLIRMEDKQDKLRELVESLK